MPVQGKMPILEVGRLPATPNPQGGLTLLPVARTRMAEIAANSRELGRQGDAAEWTSRFGALPHDSIVLAGTVEGELAVFTVLRIVNDEVTLKQVLRPEGDLGATLAGLHMPWSFPVAVTLWMEVSQSFHFQWDLAFRQVITQHMLMVASAHGCTAHAMQIKDQGHREELASAIGYHLFPAEPESSAEPEQVQVAWLHNGPGHEFRRRALLLGLRAERGELPKSRWQGDPRYQAGGTPSE
jgi:hypothetical protein